MITSSQLRDVLKVSPIYKMSLGQSAIYEAEAIQRGSLLFQSEIRFHDAVIAGDEGAMAAAAKQNRSPKYPQGNPPEAAWRVWAGNIRTFLAIPENAIVLHWSTEKDQMHWGVVDGSPVVELRKQHSEHRQPGYFFERKLKGGWRQASINNLPVTYLHPKARDLAINMATINLVQTDTDFFRALLLDEPVDQWITRPDWQASAKKMGWRPRSPEQVADLQRGVKEKLERLITPQVIQVVDDFEEDIKRMADTALKTVAYANGQEVIRTVKRKDTDLTRDELLNEIARLFKEQKNKCALTHYEFTTPATNKHLMPSLDRIDSALGYNLGNMQVVTRAANFFKSASDAADWEEKRQAMSKMALAMQKHRKG